MAAKDFNADDSIRTPMSTKTSEGVWVGIDFSGNRAMWRASRRSNVCIAEIAGSERHLVLRSIRCVQDLPGQQDPFERLVEFLKEGHFQAAGIDAPFSVPTAYLPEGGHKALLELVGAIDMSKKGPFPSAQEFVSCLLSGRALQNKKPLRNTEKLWSKQKINVRSTLWAGPRGGAAMTAACLTLLHRSGCPLWPWHDADKSGLLVEAFPAAQLRHWNMKYVKYNGGDDEAFRNRKEILSSLTELIEISDDFRSVIERSADGLDAVLCAFAGLAASTGRLVVGPTSADEGQIAVWLGRERYAS